MKRLVIFLVVLLSAGSAFSQDMVIWDSTTKLSWADFLGQADTRSTFSAVSVTGIYYKIKLGPFGFGDTILAVFYKQDSWVRDSSEAQLVHEQGHFDITEIFARKLRKARMEFIPRRGDLHQQLNQMYDDVDKARDTMERLYDQETRHSADAVMQRRWNERIRKELAELGEYAY